MKVFQNYDYKCTATFLWFTVYIFVRRAEKSLRLDVAKLKLEESSPVSISTDVRVKQFSH